MSYNLFMQAIIKHLLRSVAFVVLLCICTTSQLTVPISSPLSQDHCGPNGKVQTIQKATSWPEAQGDWPLFRGDVMRQAHAAPGSRKLTLAWAYCAHLAVFSSPVVLNGVVYVASTDATVTALNIQQARVLWQFQADSGFYSTPVINGDTLYLGSTNATVYALDIRSGHVRWKTKVESAGARIWSSPVVADGLLVFGVASTLSESPKAAGQVIALDASTGQQRWHTFTLAGGVPGGGVWSSPAVDTTQHVVYVGTGDPDDGLQVFSLSDGHLLWHWRSVVQDVSDTDVGAGPLLFPGQGGQLQTMVGGKDGYLYSLDALTGNVTWQMHIGSQIFGSPAYADGVIYAVAAQKRGTACWAIDADTGNVRWQITLAHWTYSSPVISGQTIYLPVGNGFGPGPGGVYVMDAANGHVLQYVDLHNSASSSPAVLSSWLFVGMNNGNMYAFTR